MDGQQRITTSQLLMMAIRDATLQFNFGDLEKRATKLIDKLHQLIFSDKEAGEAWMKSAAEGMNEGATTWDQLHSHGT